MKKFILRIIAVTLTVAVTSATAQLTPLPEPLTSPDAPPTVAATSWILADFDSGWMIGSDNANEKIEPASLTKLMTGYLVFEAIESGEIGLDDTVKISEKAWKTGGSRMFAEVNTEVAVGQLLRGLIIQSGNDAAVALAEFVGGSEAKFAEKMNQTAARLGMKNSQFQNASGLPNPDHFSTALDMTILTRDLIRRFPDHFRLYSEKEFTYNDITQKNRNRLLWRDKSVDGIKTGYTKAAGYCLIGTAKRGEMRLIATVIGAASAADRADQVQALLDFGYAAYRNIIVHRAGAVVQELPLWMGQQRRAEIAVNADLAIVFPKGDADKLSGVVNLPPDLEAPLAAGTEVGTFDVRYGEEVVRTVGLYVAEDYAEGEWWSRVKDWFRRLVE